MPLSKVQRPPWSENLAAVIWSSSIMPMLRATAAESLVTLMS